MGGEDVNVKAATKQGEKSEELLFSFHEIDGLYYVEGSEEEISCYQRNRGVLIHRSSLSQSLKYIIGQIYLKSVCTLSCWGDADVIS